MDPALDITALGTVLGVWAHPDDEAYLSAGLMALSREAGNRVVVATATRGEQGGPPHPGSSPAEVARVREREVVTSLSALGVHEHSWGGMPDGGCNALPPQLGERWVQGLIEEVEPATIVTFGPDGLTGHPDHEAVSRWVTDAWEAAGRRARLWYATLTPSFHIQWGALSAAAGLWMDERLRPATPVADLALHLVCEGPLLERKLKALRAHRSQTQPLIDLVGEPVFRRWWATESFADARAVAGLAVSSASMTASQGLRP